MKDLKHMIFFEKLLESANNDLVRQACEEGNIAIGYTCFHVPEVLLNLENCFSVRLRAPFTGSIDIATYYMASTNCEYARALLERGIEGGYRFLDCVAGIDVCESMNRAMENMQLLGAFSDDKPGFFQSYLDLPGKDEELTVWHYARQIRKKLLNPLHDNFGVDISNDALRKAVKKHNRVCKLITELGEFRKMDNPPITGAEFHKIVLATYVAPKHLLLDKLEETLEEVKNRESDKKPRFRARVVVVGSEIDDPDMIELIEDSGALVVADRFCYGSIPGRQEIELNDGDDVLEQIIRVNIKQTMCPRYVTKRKVDGRRNQAMDLMKEYHGDGIIYEQMKFCTYWAYERLFQSHILTNDFGIPTLSIDRPYRARSSGQLKTRVQAFVESLEIKKIKARESGMGVY